MKKLILAFFLLLSIFTVNAQFLIKFSSPNGNQNDFVNVKVETDNFTKITATQYSITYDSAVLELVDVVNKKIDYNVNVGDHRGGAANIKNGQLTFTWNSETSDPVTFPNNTALFEIRFKLIGKPCDSSFIRLANKPTSIEVLDENEEPITVNSQEGKVKVNGVGCPGSGGGGAKDFTFTASKITVPRGTDGCISVSVKNFTGIETMQATLKWNKSVAKFKSVGSFNLVDLNGGDFSINSDSTELGWVWSPNSGVGVTIPDNQVIFQVCFTAVGSNGSSTDMEFVNAPFRVIEVTNAQGNVPVVSEKGSYTIVEPQSLLTLFTRDTSVLEGTELCLPIYVNDFSCIEAFQFAIKYDNTKLRFKRVSGINLADLQPSDIVPTNDTIKVLWAFRTAGAQTLANGTSLFSLCFDVIGKCVTTTSPKFIPLGGSLEFSAGCNKPEPTVVLSEKTITIQCNTGPTDPIVSINSIGHVKCAGDCNGSASVNVTAGSGNFTYQWFDANTNQPVSPAITTKDPTNLCPGRYYLKVTDTAPPNKTANSPTITINDALPIVINASVTHESDIKNDGRVEATVTGGCQPYKYKWFRTPNNTVLDTIDKVINLRCGNYAVSVTDCNGCISKDTFRVNCPVTPLVSNITRTDSIRCFGECTGALRVETQGGAIPYSYLWAPGGQTTISISNLCAGTYTVRVTDANGNVSRDTFIITEPQRLSVVVNQIVPSSGSNGSAKTTTTGGTPLYKFEWSKAGTGVVSTTKDLTNAAPGTYTFLVTDANNCTQQIEVIIPQDNSGGGPSVSIKIDTKPGGSAVSCRGVCDGKIIATTTGGTAPITYRWSHNPNLNSNIADNLCPGTYTLTVTDALGKTSTSTSLTVNDAQDISINIRKLSCATDNTTSDGRYEAVATGGSGTLTYLWCSNEITPIADALPSGTCSLRVTDQNGCSKSQSFTVCVGTPPDEPCFKGRLAISPNGDGFNDFFVIECIENYSNTLQIFNRWGKLIFNKSNYVNEWPDQNPDEADLTEGTYMWVLTVKEPGKNDVIYRGTVTLVK